MNYKDEREYLENELKNYRYIIDMCYKYEQIIADAEISRLGTSSPSIKPVVYENAGNPYEDKGIELNEIIDEATKNLFIWQERKNWIDMRLRVLDKNEYKAVKYKYMISTKATDEFISNVIHCHRNTVRSILDRAFDKMLKVCARAQ